MLTHEYNCSVIIYSADDVTGTWVSHCLEFDVITHGSTPEQALEMLHEAVSITVCDDLARGADPSERRAPDDEWRTLKNIFENGKSVTFSTAAEAALHEPSLIALSFMLIVINDTNQKLPELPRIPSYLLSSNERGLSRLTC